MVECRSLVQPAGSDQRLDHVVMGCDAVDALAVTSPRASEGLPVSVALAPPLCVNLARDLAQPLPALLVRHRCSRNSKTSKAFVTEREHVRTPRPDLGAVAVSRKAQPPSVRSLRQKGGNNSQCRLVFIIWTRPRGALTDGKKMRQPRGRGSLSRRGNNMNRQIAWATVVASMAICATTDDVRAVSLTLTGPIQGNTLGPQSTSDPCIIAGTQCQQPAGFGFNNFTSAGNISSFNMFSTTPTANVPDGVQGTPYTGAQLDAVAPLGFVVAIDVNSTSAAGETFQLFQVIVNGVVRDSFTGPAPILPSNNGNGFGDYSLGVIAPFAATD